MDKFVVCYVTYFFFRRWSPVWPRIHHVAQAGLKLTIHLSQPLECWNCRHVPPYSDNVTLSLTALTKIKRKRTEKEGRERVKEGRRKEGNKERTEICLIRNRRQWKWFFNSILVVLNDTDDSDINS
jgi:hypothetical protein